MTPTAKDRLARARRAPYCRSGLGRAATASASPTARNMTGKMEKPARIAAWTRSGSGRRRAIAPNAEMSTPTRNANARPMSTSARCPQLGTMTVAASAAKPDRRPIVNVSTPRDLRMTALNGAIAAVQIPIAR